MRYFEATVPTVRDRVVQTAVKAVLEPIFEADFRASQRKPKRLTRTLPSLVNRTTFTDPATSGDPE